MTEPIHTKNNAEGQDVLLDLARRAGEGLVFANLVDFDTQYGHRNDPAGFARALEAFDDAPGRLLAPPARGRDVWVTADHGNDPTTPSTDHSREYTPLLVAGPRVRAGVDLGTRVDVRRPRRHARRVVRRSRRSRHGASFLEGVARVKLTRKRLMAEAERGPRSASLRARTRASRSARGAADAVDGRVLHGCNVENASFGLSCCAERTAVFKAVSEGEREFVAIAVTARRRAGAAAVRRVPAGAARVRAAHAWCYWRDARGPHRARARSTRCCAHAFRARAREGSAR